MAKKDESKSKGIDFVKLAPLMGGVSLVVTLLALVLMFTRGFNYGIDFAGGTEVQVQFTRAVSASEVRSTLESTGIANPNVQAFGTNNEFLIRLDNPKGKDEKATNEEIKSNVAKIKSLFKQKFELPEDGVRRVDTVGPAVGSELKRNGLLAAFYSFLVILIYVAMRFDYKYAPGAVICLVHDALVTLGLFSILGREVNTQIMAAVLTLIGYSLNDTIVTFDRIRETAPLNRDKSLTYIINLAINDMLGRTILTAGTTMLAVAALLAFGGGVIADIAFTLAIGIVVGTYSSIYMAAPLILVMDRFKKA